MALSFIDSNRRACCFFEIFMLWLLVLGLVLVLGGNSAGLWCVIVDGLGFFFT